MANKRAPNRRTPNRRGQTRPVRGARLETRLTESQKALIERAAAYQGRSVSDFVTSTLSSAAKAVIEEHEIIRLNAEESRRFVELLLNPPKASAALKAAADQWRRTVESR
jgi:uncharacterized protein (DUF1778 family)